jgi:hypothetical protein
MKLSEIELSLIEKSKNMKLDIRIHFNNDDWIEGYVVSYDVNKSIVVHSNANRIETFQEERFPEERNFSYIQKVTRI